MPVPLKVEELHGVVIKSKTSFGKTTLESAHFY